MPDLFVTLPDDIIEKIYFISHNILMKNIIDEIKIATNNTRFMFQESTDIKILIFLWNDYSLYKFKFNLCEYWLNNITLCKSLYAKDNMLNIFTFFNNGTRCSPYNIVKYIKQIIYSITNNKKKPLEQFHTIYLKKNGYNGKYLNTWKKAFEQLWS